MKRRSDLRIFRVQHRGDRLVEDVVFPDPLPVGAIGDASLLDALVSGRLLPFSLRTTGEYGDALAEAAILTVETFDDGAVPEPSTALLSLLGFCFVAGSLRGRRVR